MARRLHLQAALPPVIGRTAVGAALFGFLACLAAVLAVAPAAPAAIALPIAFVAALWSLPFFAALIRAESWALQILLALVLFVTIGNFRSRAWTDKSLDWQVLLKGSVWLTAGAVGALHLSRTWPLLAMPRVLAGGLFLAILLISTLWSPVPGYTLMSAGAYVCLFLFALTLVHHLDQRALLLAAAVGLGAIVVPSLMLAPVTNSLAGFSPGSTAALENRLAGLSDHPIGLAETSALFILACGALVPKVARRRWLLVVLIAVGLATMALTQSRMPGVAMLVAVTVVAVYRRGAWGALLPFVLLVGTGVTLLVLSYGLDALLSRDVLRLVSRSGSVQEVTTLSGRLRVWEVVLAQIAAAPWFGYGHAAGQEVLFSRFDSWSLVHAHNLFLQSLLFVGIIGTLPLAGAVLAQIRAFFRAPNAFRDAILFYTLILGVTETSLLSNMPGPQSLLWMLALVMNGDDDTGETS